MKNFEIQTSRLHLEIGYWGEMFMRHLLGLPLVEHGRWDSWRGKNHFDIKDGNVCWEVKMASNMHPWPLNISQFDMQDAEIPFPDGQAYYALGSFISQNGRGDVCRLQREAGETWKQFARSLGRRTNRFVILDRDLLSSMRWTPGRVVSQSKKGVPSREAIKFGRREALYLTRNPRAVLEGMGVAPEDLPPWITYDPRFRHFIQAEFEGVEVNFSLDVIASPTFETDLLKRLNGIVCRKDVASATVPRGSARKIA